MRWRALLLSLFISGAALADELVAPKALAPIEATYPASAHGDSEVVVEVIVGEDGSVVRTSITSGTSPFAEEARKAVERSQFAPATRNGIPIRARIAVRLIFHEPKAAPSPPPPTPSEPVAPEQPPAPPPPPVVEEPAEVKVLGEQRFELGSIHINREEARRVPGAFGDPFRVVEVLPGVAPVLSGLPYYFVRGAPPGSVGYFIDGIKVPLLFHVGPGPSVVAPLIIDRVDLFPGGYPSRFGRFGGAIFAGETLAPRDISRAEGQARIFDASAAVEQPFANGRGNVMLGGRYSFTQAILAAVAPDYELGYGDYQGRISYAVTPEDRVSLFAFGAFDRLKNNPRNITLFDVGFHRADLRWDHVVLGARTRVAATYAYDSVLTSPEDNGAPGTLLKNNGGRVRGEFEKDFGSAFRLRGGGDFGAEYVTGDREQGERGTAAFPSRTDFAGGAWLDAIVRPAPGIEIVPGARLDQQRSRNKDYTFFEPRLSTRTRLFPGISYLANVGLAHQLPAWSTRMPGRTPSFIEQSQQEVLQVSQGIEYALPSGMLGRTTVFRQRISVDTPGVHSESYGVEQFLRRDFTKRLGGFLSYTFSRSEGAFNQVRFLTSYDRTHVISGVLGYDFGGGFRLGARAYYASGRAYRVTCPTPDCGPGDPTAPRSFEKNLRLPGFFRLDARFEKKWMLSERAWITGTLEWFNTTLATEVENADYTAQGLVYDRQTALTLPSIGIEAGW